jgi:sugar-specific transcriptional regulator TrmB
MDIKNSLYQLGLKGREADVYLASLELGAGSVSQLAKKSGLKRTTIYDILEGLIQKGLIVQTKKGKKRLFYAEEPRFLEKLIENKKTVFRDILPLLESIHNTAGTKPKIRYYEGREGLKEIYRDTLNFSGELLAFVTENILSHLGEDFANEYIKKRKKSKITVRAIGPDTDDVIKYKKNDREQMRQTRLVPKEKFPFSIEMDIYGNKIFFASFKEQMGIIIESSEIAKNMRFLFDLAWAGAK